jgi:hypothetical protein
MVPGIMIRWIEVLDSGKKEVNISIVVIIGHSYAVGIMDRIQAGKGLNMAESLAGGTLYGD